MAGRVWSFVSRGDVRHAASIRHPASIGFRGTSTREHKSGRGAPTMWYLAALHGREKSRSGAARALEACLLSQHRECDYRRSPMKLGQN